MGNTPKKETKSNSKTLEKDQRLQEFLRRPKGTAPPSRASFASEATAT
ncbi:uncharacterized protein G2W53_033741 [Senna tora]|uniref:Uncharacterized protein n=1 Tax=Senna tora TaxID=362788 RepID=A0A834W795_9FABA|nr:uncharacterized protein G2W53_033741 [Senna tora]